MLKNRFCSKTCGIDIDKGHTHYEKLKQLKKRMGYPTPKRIHKAEVKQKKTDCYVWIPPRSEFMKPKYSRRLMVWQTARPNHNNNSHSSMTYVPHVKKWDTFKDHQWRRRGLEGTWEMGTQFKCKRRNALKLLYISAVFLWPGSPDHIEVIASTRTLRLVDNMSLSSTTGLTFWKIN